MAHEYVVLFIELLGILLLFSWFMGPRKSKEKRVYLESRIIMVPSSIIIMVIGLIILSGIVG